MVNFFADLEKKRGGKNVFAELESQQQAQPTKLVNTREQQRQQQLFGEIQDEARTRAYTDPVTPTQNKRIMWNRFKKENPEQAAVIENMSGFEKFMTGAGEGLTNVARGLGLDGGPLFAAEMGLSKEEAEAKAPKVTEKEREALDSLREHSGAAVAGAIVGETLPFIPAGMGLGTQIAKLGGVGRAAAGSALGGAEGNIISRGQGRTQDEIIDATLLGAGLGAGGEALFSAGGAIKRGIANRAAAKAKAAQEAAQPAEQVLDVPAELSPTPDNIPIGQIEPELLQPGGGPEVNVQRQRMFEEAGITNPTRAMVTRDPEMLSLQKGLSREDRIAARLGDIDTALTAGFNQKMIDPNAPPALQAYTAVRNKSSRLDEEVGRLYDEASANVSDEKTVRFQNTAKFIKNVANEMEDSPILRVMAGKMKQEGLLGPGFKPQGRISPAQAHELRKYANSFYDSLDGQGRRRLKEFKDALDQDTFEGAGEDFFADAISRKAEYERALDPAKRDKFDKRKVSLVRDIRDNKLTEERFEDAIFGTKSKYNADDLQEFKEYVGTEGEQAWKAIEQAATERLRQGMMAGRLGETPRIDKFRQAINSIGEKKLNVIYGPEKVQFLKKFGRLLALKEVSPDTVGVTTQIIPNFQKGNIRRTLERWSQIPAMGPIVDTAMGIMEKVMRSKDETKLLRLVDDVAEAAADVERAERRMAAKDLRAARTGNAIQAVGTPAKVAYSTNVEEQPEGAVTESAMLPDPAQQIQIPEQPTAPVQQAPVSALESIDQTNAAEVRRLQSAANALGANLTVDGIMGPKTRAAIQGMDQAQLMRQMQRSQNSRGLKSFGAEQPVADYLMDHEGVVNESYEDSLGKLTAGVGHLLTPEEQKKYPKGTPVPEEQVAEWFRKDMEKATKAAEKQIKGMKGPVNPEFRKVLVSVNFQLGTDWIKEFPTAYNHLRNGRYDQAIEEIKFTSEGSGVPSKWSEQTPKRVADFVKAIQGLKRNNLDKATQYRVE